MRTHRALQFTSGSKKLTTGGKEVLTTEMVEQASIVGCTQVGTSRTPCTSITPKSITAGICQKLTINGVNCVNEQLIFQTNGAPVNIGSANPETVSKISSI